MAAGRAKSGTSDDPKPGPQAREIVADAAQAQPDADGDPGGDRGQQGQGGGGPDRPVADAGDDIQAVQALVQPAVAAGRRVEAGQQAAGARVEVVAAAVAQ